jgi:hypothetical protein
VKISFDFIMIPLLQDTLDDIKPTNSSPENTGGPAYKPTLDNTLTDVRPANELEFTEINPTHR